MTLYMLMSFSEPDQSVGNSMPVSTLIPVALQPQLVEGAGDWKVFLHEDQIPDEEFGCLGFITTNENGEYEFSGWADGFPDGRGNLHPDGALA